MPRQENRTTYELQVSSYIKNMKSCIQIFTKSSPLHWHIGYNGQNVCPHLKILPILNKSFCWLDDIFLWHRLQDLPSPSIPHEKILYICYTDPVFLDKFRAHNTSLHVLLLTQLLANTTIQMSKVYWRQLSLAFSTSLQSLFRLFISLFWHFVFAKCCFHNWL